MTAWEEMTDDEKVLSKIKMFESIARSFRSSTITMEDLRQEAVIWYIQFNLPQKIDRIIIYKRMLKYIKKNEKKPLKDEFLLEHKGFFVPKDQVEMKELAQKVLNSPFLSERQKFFIDQYYIHGRTCQSIADDYNLTAEAVRLIIKEAKKKIFRVFSKNL